ncbi:MAG TPA: hypothetical protein VI874_05075 [Candidatus Norongarragalinales archaeon]|nr:hypothetical protein [Candidatus Norongarragalinales archaeon]
MQDAFDAIRSLLSKMPAHPVGKAYFSDSRYETFPLGRERFYPLEGDCRYLCGIDGGNQELLGGANASLQFVRAYANVFENDSRIHAEKHEFFALTKSVDGDAFETRLLPVRGGILQQAGVLQLSGTEVQDAEERSKAAQVGALSRRFAEWALCEKMLEKFDDILVLKDGTLQTSVKKEAFYAERVWKKAGSRKFLAALSKTSTLLTTTGWALSDAIQSLSPEGAWAYRWAAESRKSDHPARIGFAKLHPLCQNAFRVEAHHANADIPWKTLSDNAKDPGFLGYPYVLVDADRNAKVTNAECASLKGRLQVRLREAPAFSRHTDAHAWLSKL